MWLGICALYLPTHRGNKSFQVLQLMCCLCRVCRVCARRECVWNVPAPPFNVFSLTNMIPYAPFAAFLLSGNSNCRRNHKQRIAIYSICSSEALFRIHCFIRLPITFSAQHPLSIQRMVARHIQSVLSDVMIWNQQIIWFEWALSNLCRGTGGESRRKSYAATFIAAWRVEINMERQKCDAKQTSNINRKKIVKRTDNNSIRRRHLLPFYASFSLGFSIHFYLGKKTSTQRLHIPVRALHWRIPAQKWCKWDRIVI